MKYSQITLLIFILSSCNIKNTPQEKEIQQNIIDSSLLEFESFTAPVDSSCQLIEIQGKNLSEYVGITVDTLSRAKRQSTFLTSRKGPGVLEEIRIRNYSADPVVNLYVRIVVDDTVKHNLLLLGDYFGRQVNHGQVYSEGSYYKIPIGDGIKFNKCCSVKFVRFYAFTFPYPPLTTKKVAKFEGLYVRWSKAQF